MREELLKGLSEEQIAKVKACKNQEEILALAKEEGIELNEEQLAAVSGGGCFDDDIKCPKCGYTGQHNVMEGSNYKKLFCGKCGAFIKDL